MLTDEEREIVEQLAEVCQSLAITLGHTQIALQDLARGGPPGYLQPRPQLSLVASSSDA
jgi:hypothetical protein